MITNISSWEDFTLIWFDLTRTTLPEINDYVLFFPDIHIGINEIRSRENERIFLIISSEYAREYLEELHSLKQIQAIFIFSLKKNDDQFESKKIIGIFDDEEQLIHSIRKELNYSHQQSLEFAFNSIESTTFHWFYLLKEILHRMPRSDEMKDDQFSRKYSSSEAIHWYLNRTISKALRMENIHSIYLYRWYLQDLSNELTMKDEKNTFYRGMRLSEEELNKFQLNIRSYVIPKGFLEVTDDYQHALKSILQTSKRFVDLHPTIFRIEINGEGFFSSYEKEVLFNLSTIFQIINVSFDDQIWLIDLRLTNQSFEFPSDQMDWEKFIESDSTDPMLSSYFNLARRKYSQGLLQQAFEHFQIISRLQSEETPLDFIRTLNYLALITFEQKNLPSSLNYHFQILQTKHLLPDILLANTHNSIGMIFIEQHQYEHALKYLFYAMHLYEKHFPVIDQPIIAVNLNNIGLVYYYLKDYTHALEYCSKALNIREKIFSSSHSLLADCWNNIALIYHHLYEYDQALELFERSLKIYENDQQRRVPICWNNIGLVYLDQYQYDQAIECYFKALDWYLKEDDREEFREEMEFTCDNLGVGFEMKGDEENALRYYQKALENHSKNAEKFVRISTKIGNIFSKKSDYHQALIHYQNALNQSETSSMDFISSLLMSMGIIYHRQHHYHLALNIYQRVLTIRKYLASKSQLDLAWTYNNIGCVYDDMGDLIRALKYQERAHQIRRKSLPSTHPDLAISLTNLGRVHQRIAYQSGGDPWQIDQALQNYKSALHIRRKSLPMDHPDLAIAYYNLALVHIDQEEYEQAFMEVQKALKIQRRKLAIDHPDLTQTLNVEKQIHSIFQQRIEYSNKK